MFLSQPERACDMQVAYNPRALMVYTSISSSNLDVCDSAELAAEGECLSFWQLQMRAQARGWVRWAPA